MHTILKNKRVRHKRFVTGFTLLELMIGVAVLIVALVGLIAAYSGCFTLNETARNLTIAINGASKEMESVRESEFDDIIPENNGRTFSISELMNSNGRIGISSINADLLRVVVTISWQRKDRRVQSEDLVTLISRR